jgi:protein O-mannosyl-transferase
MRLLAWLKRKENWVPLAIFIAAALPFIFNLRDFFLSDDWDFLTQAAGAHQVWWRYLLTNYVGTHAGGSYRPLTIFFWLAADNFWQLNYFWYHFVQVFLHSANVVLLYFLVYNFVWPAKKADRFTLATIAAAIFILLPNHSEAVAWIAAISDPLCAFFYLTSLFLLLLGLKYPQQKVWLYFGSLASFFAALLAKEMAMSLPFVVLFFVVYYLFVRREKMIKSWIVLPYFLLLAGYLGLRYHATGLFFGYYGAEHLQFSLRGVITTYSDIVTSFILSDHWRTVFSLKLDNHLKVVATILVLSLASMAYLTGKNKWPLWPWLFFVAMLATLAPVASLGINLTATYFSEEGERYGYLPSLFFAVILAIAIWFLSKKISARRGRIAFGLVIILLALGLGGQLIVKDWRYHVAGDVAQQALRTAVSEMRTGDYIGVLFFGLPDNFHGAPIFRNGFLEAINFYLAEPPIILSPFNRTAYETGEHFTVTRADQDNFIYADANGNKAILAKPKFSSADYNTVLKDYIFEPRGTNDRYFGRQLAVSLSDHLASSDKIAVFFWQGGGWQVINTK